MILLRRSRQRLLNQKSRPQKLRRQKLRPQKVAQVRLNWVVMIPVEPVPVAPVPVERSPLPLKTHWPPIKRDENPLKKPLTGEACLSRRRRPRALEVVTKRKRPSRTRNLLTKRRRRKKLEIGAAAKIQQTKKPPISGRRTQKRRIEQRHPSALKSRRPTSEDNSS